MRCSSLPDWPRTVDRIPHKRPGSPVHPGNAYSAAQGLPLTGPSLHSPVVTTLGSLQRCRLPPTPCPLPPAFRPLSSALCAMLLALCHSKSRNKHSSTRRLDESQDVPANRSGNSQGVCCEIPGRNPVRPEEVPQDRPAGFAERRKRGRRRRGLVFFPRAPGISSDRSRRISRPGGRNRGNRGGPRIRCERERGIRASMVSCGASQPLGGSAVMKAGTVMPLCRTGNPSGPSVFRPTDTTWP
jgi:hypothetical protein